jgi:exodeoxyribonuclease-5
LNYELRGGIAEIEQRTRELLDQLGIEPVDDPKIGIAPREIAATALRTISLPEIVQLGWGLVPEYSVFGYRTTIEGEILVSGIADAIVPDGQGGVDAVIDWKSDASVSQETINHYRRQIDEYRQNLGAKRALLVFVTQSKIIEVASAHRTPDQAEESDCRSLSIQPVAKWRVAATDTS